MADPVFPETVFAPAIAVIGGEDSGGTPKTLQQW